LVTAERLVAELAGQRARFEHRNDVEHAQHGEFTERARGIGIPRYDHYTSELILLYTIAFAVGELRNHRDDPADAAGRRPRSG
jgi:hypothetical protein